MNFKDTLDNIEINREGGHDIKNTLTINGKKLKGVRNVKIEYGIDFAIPIVTIEFYAKVKGKLKKALKITKREKSAKEAPYIFHPLKGTRKPKKKKKKAPTEEPFILHKRPRS